MPGTPFDMANLRDDCIDDGMPTLIVIEDLANDDGRKQYERLMGNPQYMQFKETIKPKRDGTYVAIIKYIDTTRRWKNEYGEVLV